MSGILRSLCERARRHCRCAAYLAAAITPLAIVGPVVRAAETHEASTSEAARKEARAAIPFEKVDKTYREKVRAITAEPSVFRRMPTNVVDCQPEMFTFFAQNPEVLVEVWREMGLSRVQLKRTGAKTFRLEDGAGTTGNLVIVEEKCDATAQNRVVMYAQGSYEGKPFSRAISAECVLVLRSGSVRETNGRQYVAARLDTFVKLDRPTMELLAKAAHPFVGHTADRNFADTLGFLSNFSYTAERRPDAIERLAGKLEGVDAPRRAALTAVAHKCAAAGEEWQVSRADGPVVDVSPR